MSKKLYSTAKWKRFLKSRQLSELKKSQRRKKRRRGIVRFKRQPAARLPEIPLKVPNDFSVISNPEETIGFLPEFAFIAKNNNLNLDLRGITHITADAITALIAAIQALGQTRIVRGSIPDDPETRDILIQSGFFEHVRSRHALPPQKKGRISRQESKLVEPLIAKELIHIGTEAIHGTPQRCHGAYRALIECMSNTHNHAAGKHGKFGVREKWYSTVYADIQQRRVCYTFLDTGVGIFRSVRIGGIRKAYRLLNIQDNCDILKDILQGKVESSTGYPYRGKGLPSIYRLSLQGGIKSLILVSNDVYANVSRGEYKILHTQFPGTLLYWET